MLINLDSEINIICQKCVINR